MPFSYQLCMSLNRFFYPFRLNADVIYKATLLCAEDESFLRAAGKAVKSVLRMGEIHACRVSEIPLREVKSTKRIEMREP